jgi:hypothetical protein
MKSHVTSVGVALAIVGGIVTGSVFAQQAPVKRDFETEIPGRATGTLIDGPCSPASRLAGASKSPGSVTK